MTGEIKDDVTKNIFRLFGISGLKISWIFTRTASKED